MKIAIIVCLLLTMAFAIPEKKIFNIECENDQGIYYIHYFEYNRFDIIEEIHMCEPGDFKRVGQE